MSQL
jgi:hypothetical protein